MVVKWVREDPFGVPVETSPVLSPGWHRLGLDPGNPCGVAAWYPAHVVLWQGLPTHLVDSLLSAEPEAVVGVELPPATLPVYDPEPWQVLGLARYLCWNQGIRFRTVPVNVRAVARRWFRAQPGYGKLLDHALDALAVLVWLHKKEDM